MALKRNRDLKEIGAQNKTSREQVDLYLFNSKEKSVSFSYITWGCCSGIENYLKVNFESTSGKKAASDWCIIRIWSGNVPENFNNEEFLLSYCNFITDIDDISENSITEIKYLGRNKIEKKFCTEELMPLADKLKDKNYFYMAFRMVQPKQGRVTRNLMNLSFIRFLHYSAYWFYVDAMMHLRSNPDLKDLNNYEILQLATYANMGHSKNNRNNDGVYYYKSPCYNLHHCNYIEEDFSRVIERLESGRNLNYSFLGPVHMYDLRYMRELFHEEEYVTLYNLLVEPIKSSNKDYNGIYSITTERGTFKSVPVAGGYLYSERFKRKPEKIK